MWIRHQDKNSLIEFDSIKADTIPNSDGKFCVWDPVMSLKSDILGAISIYGEYSTKEQALEVIDEIQERINEGCPYVYQMPEDNNIEEE
jgi:hypothetical protein